MATVDELLKLSRWLQSIGDNAKTAAQDPASLWTSLGEDLRKFSAKDMSSWEASRSVMPEVRAQGAKETLQNWGDVAGMVNSIKFGKAEAAQLAKVAKMHGGDLDKTYAMMDRFGDYMGTNTASAKPPQNVRAASFHLARSKQDLPVPDEVQYPYGHKMYGTHAGAMTGLEDLGYIDSMKNPKGATFSGNISGKTDDATIDKVMSNKIPLRSAGGEIVDAPDYYGYPRDWMRDVAATKGVKPKEVQASAWVGWNEAGGKPLMQVLGDRIAVTSAVTGLPQKKVYDLFRRLLDKEKKGGMPLLTTAPFGFGLIAADQFEDQ